jgi:hypothetical protein
MDCRLGEFSSFVLLCTPGSLKKSRNSPKFWATFFHGKTFELMFTKIGWVTIWAIFFSNSLDKTTGKLLQNLRLKLHLLEKWIALELAMADPT